ncbi:Mobile element protein [Azospirillum melinis]
MGTKKRHSWLALHIGMDAASGRIVAATLTGRDSDDAAQVGLLLDQVPRRVASLTGDGAYDRTSVYAAVQERHPGAGVVAPPRCDAVLSDTADSAPSPRDRHIQTIAETGRRAWQKTSSYNRRAMVEGQIGRWKQVLGPALRFHTDDAQATEVAIGVMVLNRMLNLGRPNSVSVT